jgi:hypothetical protein
MQRRVPCQPFPCEAPGQRCLGFRRRSAGAGGAQRGHDALADLSGGLAGEGHGNDGLGPLDPRQQGEIALD